MIAKRLRCFKRNHLWVTLGMHLAKVVKPDNTVMLMRARLVKCSICDKMSILFEI